MLTQKIKLPSNINFFFISLKNSRLLVLKTFLLKKKYIEIPSFIKLSKKDNFLFLTLTKATETASFLRYTLFLTNWLKNVEKPFKKQLLLKGLGFRAALVENSNVLELEFKLGLSHLPKIIIPTDELKVSVDKTTLTVEGFDPVVVGNFVEKIRNLKFPDAYKGKGFWHKNEIRILKEIKKT